ncbi:MAG: metallophosphoesterase [Acidimicrobiia bacterium]|nr:metallophosphoesterase [Acidimicrobiia bacterium]
MDTLTAPPVRPLPGFGVKRRSRFRAILRGAGLIVLVGILGLGFAYRRQIGSWLTHHVGSPEHRVPFVAFPIGAQPDLHLAVVGDVGDGGDLEWRLASTMYVAGRSDDPYDALLLLGDNVYPYGDPAKLDEYVFRPFAAVTDTGATLYSITGNHDALADDGGLAQLEALGMPGFWWTDRVGDVLLVGVDSNQVDNAEQLAFLETTLMESDALWKVVAVHHPPYSAGYQGSAKDVREKFSPIFERHGVQLVLSGHEHDYQRTDEINGVTYVVSGAGAGTRRTGNRSYTAYSASTMNFVDVNVFEDRMVLRAVDHELMVFDEFILSP